MRGISCAALPIPDHAFFEQSVLERQLGYDLLQSAGLSAQVLDLIRGGGSRRVTRQPLLARFQKVLRPAVIEVLDNSFAPAQLGDAVLAAQPLQHDTDLVFGRKMPPGRPADSLHNLISRLSYRPGFLSHLRSFYGLR